MKLTIDERLLVKKYIPRIGHYADMVETRKIDEVLAFTPEEITQFEMTFDEKGFRMNYEKARVYLKDIPFSEWMTRKIQSGLMDDERAGNLERDYLTLYEKFVKDMS
jgi:hypothetical protein